MGAAGTTWDWLTSAASSTDLALYLVGWFAGWFLLWRLRPLPAPHERPTGTSLSVVIPARDEADALPDLLPGVLAQLRPGDDLVVVDDHSTDDTATVATRLGARVVRPPTPPDGWLGKPHACWHGARETSGEGLLFVDADVRPSRDLLDRVRAALDADPGPVHSVQPWHATETAGEQASILCNVVALMGSGAFTPLGARVEPRVAYGPVLALRRSVYSAVGGHAADGVRGRHTEDIGLAREVGRSRVYTGRPDITFRMYPAGTGQVIRGWTRSLATGARSTPWWAGLLLVAWVWSLAGGWLAAPLLYPLSALQVWVLGRRAGSIHPMTALLYPLAVAVFLVIFVRSAVAVVFGLRVPWKGRRVDARTG